MQKIVIIGKKNVGKSSLFNLLTKSKKAINVDFAGFTRSCNFSLTKIRTNVCEIIDTAGLGYEECDLDYKCIRKTWDAINKSDIIIVLSDVENELILSNKNITNSIKNLKQKKIYVVNKIDKVNNFINKKKNC